MFDQDDVVNNVVGAGKFWRNYMSDDEENSFIDISFFRDCSFKFGGRGWYGIVTCKELSYRPVVDWLIVELWRVKNYHTVL